MEYARLGSTGMKVSRICLGCMGFGDAERWVHKWVLNEENSRPIIKTAHERGDPRTGPEGFRESGRGRNRHQAARQNA